MEIPRYVAPPGVPTEEVLSPGQVASGPLAIARTVNAVVDERQRHRISLEKAESDGAAGLAQAMYDSSLAELFADIQGMPRVDEDGKKSHEVMLQQFDERSGLVRDEIAKTMTRGKGQFLRGATALQRSVRNEVETLRQKRQIEYIKFNASDAVDIYVRERRYDDAMTEIENAYNLGGLSPGERDGMRKLVFNAANKGTIVDMVLAGESANARDILADREQMPHLSVDDRMALNRFANAEDDRIRQDNERAEKNIHEVYEARFRARVQASDYPSVAELSEAARRNQISQDGYISILAETNSRLRTGLASKETRMAADLVVYNPDMTADDKRRALQIMAINIPDFDSALFASANAKIESRENSRRSERKRLAISVLRSKLKAPPENTYWEPTDKAFKRNQAAVDAEVALADAMAEDQQLDPVQWASTQWQAFEVTEDDIELEPPDWYDNSNPKSDRDQLSDFIKQRRRDGVVIDENHQWKQYVDWKATQTP